MSNIATTSAYCNGAGDYEVIFDTNVLLDVDGEDSVREIESRVCEQSKKGELHTVLDKVPSYKSDFSGFMTDPEFSMDTGKPIYNDARPKKTCFNCLGDHSVNECPQKLNHAIISQNRRKIMTSRSNIRYHEDDENKYCNLVPGSISNKLQQALGLKPHQIPEFVYRMRILGYPPGWLKEAQVDQSDVSLFDGDGKAIRHPDEEEGEIEEDRIKYQPGKLISYPGFNIPLLPGFKEEGHRYNCPPMCSFHQRSEFEKFMNMNKVEAYKKRKLDNVPHKRDQSVVNISTEMDVDDSLEDLDIEVIPPLPEEPFTQPPLPLSNPEEAKEEGEMSDDSDSDKSKQDQDLQNSENSESHCKKNDRDISDKQNAVISSSGIEGLVKKHHRAHSKGYSFGAAIPESCSPYRKLPHSEKWTVDVSDHINFDNLPDSVGTWNKMKDIVTGVRKTMDVLHPES